MLNAVILKVRQPIESTVMFAANDTVYFYDRENNLSAVNTFNLETTSGNCKTGYSQNWNRDYDPSTGRYLQPDIVGILNDYKSSPELAAANITFPFAQPPYGNLNQLYGYAEQNPVMLVDETGLGPGSPQQPCIICGGWHGGSHGDFCPWCSGKGQDPDSGIPQNPDHPDNCPNGDCHKEVEMVATASGFLFIFILVCAL